MSHQADYPLDLASMVAWVDQVARPGERVLDLGCGDGSMVAALADRYEVLGVDPHAGPGEHVRVGRVEDLDEEPFDVIVASLSLHHLPDPAATAAALRRLSRPGTRLLVREFDRVRMDHAPSLRWWFHQRQALDAVAPDPRDHPLPPTFDEFVDWWRSKMHGHVLPWADVHAALLDAGVTAVSERWGPHLFRWGLLDSLRPTEQELIDRGRLVAVGVRWHGVAGG